MGWDTKGEGGEEEIKLRVKEGEVDEETEV